MKFVNANFIRGDKQRCLLMRSIVKKALPVQQQPQASQHQQQVLPGGGMLPPFVQNTMGRFGMGMPVMGMGQYGMGMGGGGTSMPPHRPLYSQDARQLPFLPSANQGGCEDQNNMMNSLPVGAPPSMLFGVANLYSHGATSMGMMSADMFEAGMHLERMEQPNQQQRQMQQMMGFNNLNVSNSQPINDQPQAVASLTFNQQQSVPPAMRYYGGNSYGNSDVGGHTDAPNYDGNASDTSSSLVVDIATQLMTNDPNLLPRQALDMAMQMHNQIKKS